MYIEQEMVQQFDYKKYIWQIQFEPMTVIPSSKYIYHTTIDYINRIVIQSRTNTLSLKTKDKVRKISNRQYQELLDYSTIESIKAFNAKSEKELLTLDCGYRDGWYLPYSYFTKEDPSRIDGLLGTIYKGNPIEDIAKWISKEFPLDGFWY